MGKFSVVFLCKVLAFGVEKCCLNKLTFCSKKGKGQNDENVVNCLFWFSFYWPDMEIIKL